MEILSRITASSETLKVFPPWDRQRHNDCGGSLHLLARVFQNPLRARRVKHTTGTKSRHIRYRLGWRAPALFDPVDHLLGQACRNHPMAAHGRDLEQLSIGEFFRRPFEPQRIPDAVASDAGKLAALLRSLDRG